MYQKLTSRTDLAMEAAEIYKSRTEADRDGIEIKQCEQNGFTINTMTVKTEHGAKKIGKAKGKYVTIQLTENFYNMPEYDEVLSDIISKQLLEMTGSLKGKAVLTAGLGNRAITADCIGPKAVENLLITRHIRKYVPYEISKNLGEVCAVAPGVLGITGIETGEILSGICEKVKPDVVILIDALAAKSIKRVVTTVQMCNSAIAPGSGVGNRRFAIDENLLGAKVYVIGVPTVVDAYTMLCDISKKDVISAAADDIQNMTVTPKDIDAKAKRMASVIAFALNKAFNPNLTDEEINYLTNY